MRASSRLTEGSSVIIHAKQKQNNSAIHDLLYLRCDAMRCVCSLFLLYVSSV